MGQRLAWAGVVAVGANVRTVEVGDRVLFDPEDRAEVEVRGHDYVLLRERDLHAVAAQRLQDEPDRAVPLSSLPAAPVANPLSLRRPGRLLAAAVVVGALVWRRSRRATSASRSARWPPRTPDPTSY